MTATYHPDSKQVSLQIDDQFATTEETLNFIDSLKTAIADFENLPQVEEFAGQFKHEGIKVIGTVYRDTIRMKTHPDHRSPEANPSIWAEISYDIPTRSILSYSLPNQMLWREFPLIPVIHKIINEQLHVGELSVCAISMKKEAYANTTVQFLPESPSVKAMVKITCAGEEDDKSLILILHPDGSYDLEGIR
jgi:hypothetical protein